MVDDVNLLDYWFGRFKSYRRYRGGQWFLVGPGPAQPDIGVFWIKGSPRIMERTFEIENYDD